MSNTLYKISELFESIQGEGNFSGVNSLFVRFQYCNLTCKWCDTKYTWKNNSGEESYTIDELNAKIKSSKPHHVIFTGGEPTLFRLDLLAVSEKKYHVESNGSIIPIVPLNISLPNGLQIKREPMNEKIIKNFNWVISPKLSNSEQVLNNDSMQYWAKFESCVFKFIIANIKDIIEVSHCIEKFKIDKRKVYLGIEGTTIDSQLQPELVDEIIKHGYNFSPRLHVMLWEQNEKNEIRNYKRI